MFTSDAGVKSLAATIVEFVEKHVLRNVVTKCAIVNR